MAKKKTYYDPHDGNHYYHGETLGASNWGAPESVKDESYINQYNYTPSYNAYRQYLEEEKRRREEEERRAMQNQVLKAGEQGQIEQLPDDGQPHNIIDLRDVNAARTQRTVDRIKNAADSAINPLTWIGAKDKVKPQDVIRDQRNDILVENYTNTGNDNNTLQQLDQKINSGRTLTPDEEVQYSEAKLRQYYKKHPGLEKLMIERNDYHSASNEIFASNMDDLKKSNYMSTALGASKKVENDIKKLTGWNDEELSAVLKYADRVQDRKDTLASAKKFEIDQNSSVFDQRDKGINNTIYGLENNRGVNNFVAWADNLSSDKPKGFGANTDNGVYRKINNSSAAIGETSKALKADASKIVSAALGKDKGEFIGDLAGRAYESGVSAVDSELTKIPGIIVSAATGNKQLGEAVGLAPYFFKSFNSDYIDARQKGATEEEARQRGTLSGLIEVATELVGLDKFIDNTLGKNAGKSFVKNLILQMASEGLEEGLSDILNEFADSALYAGDDEVKSSWQERVEKTGSVGGAFVDFLKDFGLDIAFGAVSAGPASGGSMALGAHNYGNIKSNISSNARDVAQNIKGDSEYEKSVKAQMEQYEKNPTRYIADNLAENTEEDKQRKAEVMELAKKEANGEKLTAGEKLFIEQAIAESEESQKAQAKKDKKEGKEDYSKISEQPVPIEYRDKVSNLTEDEARTMLAKAAADGDADAFADAMQMTMASSYEDVKKNAQDIIKDYTGMAMSHGISQESIGQAMVSRLTAYEAGLSGETMENLSERNQIAYNEGKQAALAEKARTTIEGDAVKNTEVTKKDGSSVKLEGAFTSDGIQTSDGVVKVEDLDLTSDSAVVKAYRYADRYDNVNVKNAFLSNIKGGQNIEQYRQAFDKMYDSAMAGVSYENAKKSYTAVDEDVLKAAYTTGQTEAGERSFDALSEALGANTKKGSGNFTNESSALDANAVQLFTQLAKRTGLNIRVVDNMNSKTARGSFNAGNSTITLRADEAVYAVNHELAEFTEVYNKAEYDKLRAAIANFSSEKLGNDKYLRFMRQYKNAYARAGQDSSADEMSGEMFNDTVAIMMSTDKGRQALVDYLAQNYDEAEATALGKQLSDFVKSLAKAIKKAFQGIGKRKGYEGEMQKYADELSEYADQFIKALNGAVEAYKGQAVNNVTEVVGVHYDAASEMVYPADYSLETWDASDYQTDRKNAAKDLAKVMNISQKKALEYIDDINSIAKIIADDRVRLDYDSDEGSAVVSNSDYGASVDFSTICKKRLLYTGTLQQIQKQIGNRVITVDDYLDIRQAMIRDNLETTCGCCYVEGSRAKLGGFMKEFIKKYAAKKPEYVPTMYDVSTPDGIRQLRTNHPEVYKAREYFLNHYGKIDANDTQTLFASQQKPKDYTERKAYKGEILKMFKGKKDKVAEKNLNGGLRLQSFSDFEVVNLLDCMQVITDMSRCGLAGQAYTKVKNFADALGNTGLKINLSLMAKGVDKNGNLILDEMNGMKKADAEYLRNKYSKNVGTIIVCFTDEQIKAAMKDDMIDFIIPFHRSQWQKSQYEALGLPEGTKDYTNYQEDGVIGENGRRRRADHSYMSKEYWDFSKSGRENAETYIKMCNDNNKVPVFDFLLDKDKNGKYVLPKDADGYFKLLIDFKMYDNNGVGSPQVPVTPNFSLDECRQMLTEYEGGHETFPVDQKIADEFTKKITKREKEFKYSLDVDSEGNELTEEQADYFKDSQIRDENGKLKVMYHGTQNKFTVFDPKKLGGKNGTAEGYGIYFAEDPEISGAYGNELMKGYVNITHPATAYKKSIKANDLAKLIKATATKEAEQMVADGEYDSVEEAIKDSWVSNYVYTNDKPMDAVYKQVAEEIIKMNSHDMDIIQEVMSGLAIRDYNDAYDFYDTLTDTLGIDGFVTEWESADGKTISEIVVAFNSNQFKNIDNQSPTENEDIRLSIDVDAINADENINILDADMSVQDAIVIDKDIFAKNAFRRAQGRSLDYVGVAFSADFVCLYKNEGDDYNILEFVPADSAYANIHEVNAYGDTYGSSERSSRLYAEYRDNKEVRRDLDLFLKKRQGDLSDVRISPAVSDNGRGSASSNVGGDKRVYSLDTNSTIDLIIDSISKYEDLVDDVYYDFIKDEIESVAKAKTQNQKRQRASHLLRSMLGKEFDVVDGKKIAFTDERIEKLLKMYAASNQDYGQAYLTYMSPADYLLLTANGSDGTRTLDRIKEESHPLDIDELKEVYDVQPIFLDLAEKGVGRATKNEIIGHEGRHRMYALQLAGFDQIPVLVFNYDNKYSKKAIDSISVYPQTFNDVTKYGKNNMVELTNLQPLTRGNEENIKEMFGPGQEADLRFSLDVDSDGNELSKDQKKFFKDSKVVDDNGSLKVMYHGTGRVGFTVFDPNISDDKRSLFFTDSLDVAKTYSGVHDTYTPDAPMSYEELSSYFNDYTGGEYYLGRDGNDILVMEVGMVGDEDSEAYRGNLKGAQAFFTDYMSSVDSNAGANYKVYLNLKNPLIIDAEGAEWNNITPEEYKAHYKDVEVTPISDDKYEVEYQFEDGHYEHKILSRSDFENIFGKGSADKVNVLYKSQGQAWFENIYVGKDGNMLNTNTREVAEYAHNAGYDGVIFKNLYDIGLYASSREYQPSTVAVAFRSEQVKSVDNLTPTSDPDIRYSIDVDSEGRELTEGQQRYFDNTKAVDENGALKVMYHGTESGGFTVFDPEYSDDKISLFFSDSRDVAESYQKSVPHVFNANEQKSDEPITTNEQAVKYLESIGYSDMRFERGSQRWTFKDPDGQKKSIWDQYFKDMAESRRTSKNVLYPVYLNLQNPMVIDAHKNQWNRLTGQWLTNKDNGNIVADFIFEKIDDGMYGVWSNELEYDRGIMSLEEIEDKFGEEIANDVMNNEALSYTSVVYNPTTKKVYPNNTRTAAQMAKARGYDGVIIKNVKDNGGGAGWDIEKSKRASKPSTIIIAFNPEQVKDINNLNPTSSEDIRYALDLAEDEGGWASLDDLLGLDTAIGGSEEKAVDILEKGMEALKNKEVDLPKLRTLALKIRNEFGSSYNVNTLTENLRKAFAYMQTEDHVDYQTMMGILKDIARPVIEESNEKVGQEEYKQFVDLFKGTKIKLTAKQKEEVKYTYGSYGKFRNAIMPITISDNAETTLDQIWDELVEQSGFLLDRDAKEGDMPLNLLDTLQAMRPTLRNTYGGDIEDVSRDLAMRIVEEYFEGESAKQMKQEISEIRARLKKDYDERRKELKGQINAEARARNKRNSEKAKDRERTRYLKQDIKMLSNKLLTWINKPVEGKSVPHNLVVPITQFLQGIDFVDPVVNMTQDGKYTTKIFDHVDLDDNNHPIKFYYNDIVGDTRADVIRQYNEALGRGEGSKEQRSWAERMQGVRDIYNKVLRDDDFEDTSMDSLMQGLDAQGLAEELDDMLSRHKGSLDMNHLSSDDLNIIDKVLKNIIHAVNQANKAYSSPSVDIVNLAQSTIQDAEGKEIPSRNKILESVYKMFRLDNVTPRTYFKLLGKRGIEIYKFLRDGLNQEIRDLKQASDFMEGAMEGIDATKWTGRTATVHEFPVSSGTIRMTDGQIMSLYCTVRRNGATERIKGGLKADDIYTKGAPIQQKAMHLTDADIAKIESVLTPEQIALAQKMQKYMAQDCSIMGNETSMKLYGYKKFTDDTYYPWTVDKDTVATTNTSENIPMFTGIERSGFTKQLKEGATNPLVIRDIFDVFTDHVSQMAAYHGYAAAVKDTLRWMNYREQERKDGFVEWITNKNAINALTGTNQGVSYIRNLLLDINKANKSQYIGNMTDILMGNYKAAAVGANLRVVAQQPTAYFRALNMIDPKYLFTVNPKTAIRNITKSQEECPISWWKSKGYYETNLGQPIKEIVTGIASPIEKAKDKLMAPAGWADDVTWGFLYSAVEKEQRDKLKGKNVSEKEFRKAVNDRFDEIVDNTQVVDSTLHRSQYMRSKDRLNKIQTAFMAEPTKSYNMLLEAGIEDLNDKDKTMKRTRRATTAFLLSALATSAAAAVVDALRKSKDDDKWWEVWLDNLKSNMADNMNPFNLLPVVKDVSAYVYNLATGNSTYGMGGSRFDTEAISSFMGAISAWKKLIEGESNKTAYGFIMANIKPLSQITGVPAYNLTKDVVALYNAFFTNIETTVGSQNAGRTEKKKDFVSDVNRERSEKILDEGIVSALEHGISIYDLKGALETEYKNKYFEAYAENNEEEAKTIAEKAARAYARMGLTDEEIDEIINGWQEEVVTYAALDKAIADGSGDIIVEAMRVKQAKGDEKVIKHLIDKYAQTIAYEDTHDTDSHWRENVEWALHTVDPTLDFDDAHEENLKKKQETAEKAAQTEKNSAMKADFYDAVEAKDGSAGRKALETMKSEGVEAKTVKTSISTRYHEIWKKAESQADKDKAKSDWKSAYTLVDNVYGTKSKDLDKTWADWEKDQKE